ncbi:4-hydroxybenzoate polyprenyltransferase [Sandarakinorhabdus cyanobacteriorum]|uniref:4-hydroxybenzoate octaprenyltransferase n=1 Tax=Sandarakinorhabdus cyanobacteriorum TaxID=1981098 RepID=A0A255YA43_9SPHN|nr:4-hydroxybenzoate octaprenyltransferase [Sandarakinorhabdus cyanobacteriorum]OYQ26079.1 4-hydroxybenzoate polyprenyltransferase [Sandarakinorhabdus cyanobacteriorum]
MGPVVTPPAPITPDAVKGWIDWLPARAQDYARLARMDRPAGTWLLFWPCVAGLALAGGMEHKPLLLLWFGLGSLAMRGAGCVWNDIVDRDLDAQVERTRLRPVAAGRVSLKAALAFAVALSLIGLIVLLQLRATAQLVALASLFPVAAYPFMKRITWWPQAWLGLTFNWGALVGWAAVAPITDPAMWLLWAGGIAWTLGYDTIYALQDIEDDALAGIKSSARALGGRARVGVAVFYAIALILWAISLYLVAAQPLAVAALLPLVAHFGWQVAKLADPVPETALTLFRANRWAGALLAAACAAVGLA